MANIVSDNGGNQFDLEMCVIDYVNDTDGNATKMTATLRGVSYVKDQTWTNGFMTRETPWVKQ